MELLFEEERSGDGKRAGEHVEVVAMTSAPEAERVVQVLETIACELCWQPGEQLREFQADAVHLAVMLSGVLAGGLQAVRFCPHRPFPFRRVWPGVVVDEEHRALHVTMMALHSEYRGHFHLFWPLCVELWRTCVAQGVQTIVIEATPSTLRLYQRLGWPLEAVGDLRMHWGEPCLLCQMDVQQVAQALTLKAERSRTHRLAVEQAYRDSVVDEIQLLKRR